MGLNVHFQGSASRETRNWLKSKWIRRIPKHHPRIDFGEIDLRRPISPKSALRNASQRCAAHGPAMQQSIDPFIEAMSGEAIKLKRFELLPSILCQAIEAISTA